MIKRLIIILPLFLSMSISVIGQGYDSHWLISNWTTVNQAGRFSFDTSTYIYNIETRKMGFWGTQGNISDAQGNFLMSSNGVWIANANNDTMLNGSGLNPGDEVNSWPNGLLLPFANVFVPFPGDTNKFVLLHHAADFNGQYYPATKLFQSVIDITLNGGLGGVILKNDLILTLNFNYGIGLCKHANGRDWWIVVQNDLTDEVSVLLLTPFGVSNVGSQHLQVVPSWGNVTQLTFSPDGTKFGYTSYSQTNTDSCSTYIFDFDRCSGLFSNTRVFNFYPSASFWGFSFSPNSKFAYSNTINNLFQFNIDSLSYDTVATYDGFSFPIPAAATTFMFEYLAANGKIYLTSGGSSQHIHEINYPDSVGLACDVQQHAIPLGVWHFRAVPNHPNYNLGPVLGSVCDTLSVGIPEQEHDFRFGISPNPSADGYINIIYLLPQNKAGVFEVYNMTGQLVYKMQLPPWSTLQQIKLPELSSGVYTCVVRSGYERVGRKLVVMK